MKQAQRLVSLFLVVMMFVSLLPNASFAQQPVVEDMTPARLHLEEQVQGKLEQDDKITLIVELNDAPMGDIRLMSQTQQQKESDRLQAIQDSFSQTVARQGIDAKEVYRYKLLLNGISFDTTWEQAQLIASLPGVKRAEVAPEYNPPEVWPQMGTSNGLVHSDDAWDLGFKGEGRLVAVLDSGADPQHQDFVLTDVNQAMYPTQASANEVITDNSLPGRWFNDKIPYGWNYRDNDDGIKEVLKKSGMHGMHVAGTVAANGKIKGVAPEAQLLIMRVFGEAGGGTNAGIYIKAIEDAVVLQADSVNMSLGSPSGVVSDVTSLVVQALTRASELGTVVNIAGGNEGQFAYSYDQPYATAPDYGVVGSPAVTPLSLAVASMENTTVMLSMIEKADGSQMPYQISDSSRIPTYGQLYDVADGGLGTVAELADKDLTGKVALIQRGDITFVDKVNNAAAKGAAAVFIYNTEANGDAFINMGLDGTSIPGLSIRRSDALALIAAPQQVKILNQVGAVESPTKGYLSDFSNWGISTEFDLKPEIAAPGGNIYSTLNDNSYGNMSGTSMATPHVAGGVSLVHQRLIADYPGITGTNRYTLIKNLLMSHAVPQNDPDTLAPVSPRKQGAGLMNLKGAVEGDLIVTATGGLSKLLLGDVTDTFNLTFSVKNYGTESVTLPVSVKLVTDKVEAGQFTLQPRLLTTVTADPITVAAGASTDVTIPVDASEFSEELLGLMPNGYFLEGYVYLGDDTTEQVSLPFVGFRGEWNKLPILEDFVYNYDDLTQIAPQYYTETGKDFSHFFTRANGAEKIMGEVRSATGRTFDKSIIGISPNSDNHYDSMRFRGTFLRNYKQVQLIIYKEDSTDPVYSSYSSLYNTGKKNHFSGRTEWLKSESQSLWSWDGKVNNQVVADGNYIAEMKGALNREGAESVVRRLPFKVDTKAPAISQLVYDAATGYLTFVVDDGAGVGLANLKVTDANGQVVTPDSEGRYQVGINADTTKVRVRTEDHVLNVFDDVLATLIQPVSDSGTIITRGETSDDSPLPEYDVKVVNEAGEEQTSLSDLPFGTYTATVENLQAGYEAANPSVEVTLSQDNPQVTIVFQFAKIIIPTERVTFSVTTSPASATYPGTVQVEVFDEAGNRYLTTQDAYIDRYHDVDLPHGSYTARVVAVSEGWMSNPDEIKFTVSGPDQIHYFDLIQGAGGQIKPVAKDETGTVMSDIQFQAVNNNGYPVDITATLPFGDYYVAVTEASLPTELYSDPVEQKAVLSSSFPLQQPEFVLRAKGTDKGSLTINTLKASQDYPDFNVVYQVSDYYGNTYQDMSQLEPGTYYVKPVEYPLEYTFSPEQAEVIITPDNLNQTVDFTFSLLRGTGSGRITIWLNKPYTMTTDGKLDVVGSDGQVRTVDFNRFSSMINVNVPYDYYVIRPNTIPEGFYMKEDFVAVQVISNYHSADVTIVEGEKPAVVGKLTIFSTDEQGVALTGASYEVRNSAGEVVTDLNNLSLGSYTVTMVTAPTGFKPLVSEQTIELTTNLPYGKVFIKYEPGEVLPVIVSVENPVELTVPYGTSFEALALPTHVTVSLNNDTTEQVAVTWDKGNYDGQLAGTYELIGQLDLTDKAFTNDNNLTAVQKVTVEEEIFIITAIESLRDLFIPYGMTFEDLGLPSQLEVSLNNGTKQMMDIVWQAGNYDPNQAGDYVLIGQIQIPDGARISNPNQVTAQQKITLLDKVIPVQPIVSLKPLAEITVAQGTDYNELKLPTNVTAVLDSGTEIDLRVTWAAGNYDGLKPATYQLVGTLEIPEVIRISNPDDLVPTQVVIVEAVEPTRRVAGDSRYDTAVKLALENFSQADTVIIASGVDFPDALSAVPFAYAQDVPLLLTAKDQLAPATSAALKQLGTTKAIILGGQLAIQPAVEDALVAMGITTERISGETRYHTAGLVGKRLAAKADHAYLVSGENFADAISIGVDASLTKSPILLTAKAQLPAATKQALKDMKVTKVTLLGGELAIVKAVEQELIDLGIQVTRLAAATRYDTNVLVVKTGYAAAKQAVFASGENFADALTGSLYAAKRNQPLILSRPDELVAGTKQLLQDLPLYQVTILGGELAISPAVELEVQAIIMAK